MTRSFHHLFGAAALVVLSAGVVSAQNRAERPYRGLFAGDASSTTEQSLTATGSLGAGFDTSILADAAEAGLAPGAERSRSQKGGFVSVSEGLSYSLAKTSISFGANGSASARYYPTVENSFLTNYGGGAGVTWSVSRRTTLSANQSITYQPFNLQSLYPQLLPPGLGQPDLPDMGYGALDSGYYSYQSGVGFSRQLSARASISGEYSYNRSDFSSGYPDYSSQSVSGRFTRGLTAGLGLRIGYGYTIAQYQNGQDDFAHHMIDTGVDYNKTLSFSRRTKLTFSTGGSAMRSNDQTHFTAIGNANLSHEIGRTWSFDAAYNRNVGITETFAAPFVYDAANASLQGLLGRRVNFHAGAGAMLGNLGFSGSANNEFNDYYATTGVGTALNRFLRLSVDYTFSRYDFAENRLLPSGFSRDSSRHNIHASISAWLPLMQRGRRPNASR